MKLSDFVFDARLIDADNPTFTPVHTLLAIPVDQSWVAGGAVPGPLVEDNYPSIGVLLADDFNLAGVWHASMFSPEQVRRVTTERVIAFGGLAMTKTYDYIWGPCGKGTIIFYIRPLDSVHPEELDAVLEYLGQSNAWTPENI